MSRAVLVVAVCVAVAAPDAHAKCCALTTPPAPHGLAAGQEWFAQLELQGDEWPQNPGPLTVIAWSDSTPKLVSVEARRTATRGVYVARVVFPEEGVWQYTVTFGGFAGSVVAPSKTVTVGPMRRRDPRIAAVAAPVLAALILLAIVARRRGRLGSVG